MEVENSATVQPATTEVAPAAAVQPETPAEVAKPAETAPVEGGVDVLATEFAKSYPWVSDFEKFFETGGKLSVTKGEFDQAIANPVVRKVVMNARRSMSLGLEQIATQKKALTELDGRLKQDEASLTKRRQEYLRDVSRLREITRDPEVQKLLTVAKPGGEAAPDPDRNAPEAAGYYAQKEAVGVMKGVLDHIAKATEKMTEEDAKALQAAQIEQGRMEARQFFERIPDAKAHQSALSKVLDEYPTMRSLDEAWAVVKTRGLTAAAATPAPAAKPAPVAPPTPAAAVVPPPPDPKTASEAEVLAYFEKYPRSSRR